MPSNLDDLLVRIDASTELLRRELNKGEGSVTKFERNVDSKLDKVDKRFAALGKNIRGVMGAFGLGVGITGLTRFAQSAIALGASIDDAANNAGIGAERLQRLQYAFEQNGVASNEFDMAMQRLNRRLGMFIQDGGGPAATAIKRLGLEADITNGKIRTSEALFDAVVAQMQNVETAAERAAVASQLFGDDAGPRLVQALSLGTEGLREFEQAAKGIMSDEQVAKAAAIDDAFNHLSRTIGVTLKGAVVSAAAAFTDFWGSAATLTTPAAIEEQIAKLEKTAKFYRDQLSKGLIPEGGSGASTLAQIDAELDVLYKRLVRLSDTKVTIPVEIGGTGTGGEDPFPITDIAGPRDEGGFPTVYAGPNMFPSREEYDRVNEQLAALEEQALRSQGRMAEVIRMAADQQIEEWRRVAEETPAFAEQAAEAIEYINAKAAGDIANTMTSDVNEVSDAAQQLGMTFTSAFEDAIVQGGRLSEVLRGLAQDLARMLVRKTLFAPIAGFFDKLIPEPRAAGGPVTGGKPYLVGEVGPELFIPDVPGRILNNRQLAGAANSGASVTINQNNQVGLPPQWQAQLAAVAQIAASAAKQELQKELGGRR